MHKTFPLYSMHTLFALYWINYFAYTAFFALYIFLHIILNKYILPLAPLWNSYTFLYASSFKHII